MVLFIILKQIQWRIQDLTLEGMDFVNRGGGGGKSVEGWIKSHF